MSESIRELLVLTSYPEKYSIHGHHTGGVASYTKQLLLALKKQFPQLNIRVYADRFGPKDTYQEHEMLIHRRWVRGRPKTVWRVFRRLATEESKHVLISFEAYMWGGLQTAGLLILGTVWLRLSGKRVTIMLHQVLDDFHYIEKNFWKAVLLNFIKSGFYWTIKKITTQLVVFEEELKTRMGNGDSVYVLPHLIPRSSPINKNHAKALLGWKKDQKYALYFGFIALYKGVDWLVENWPIDSEYTLIIAGNLSNTQKNHPDAIKLFNKIQTIAQQRGIQMVGFVPENMISTYFSACDLVVLPYQLFMSSSGPLSLAIAYEKPILLSEALKAYKQTEDLQMALESAELKFENLTFQFTSQSLQHRLRLLPNYAQKSILFTRRLKHYRSRQWISKVLFAILSRKEQLDIRPMMLSRYIQGKIID